MQLLSFLLITLFFMPAWADVAAPVSPAKIDGCVEAFSGHSVIDVLLILCVSVVLCSIILFVVFAKKDILNNKKKKLFFILPSILLIIFLTNLIPGHPCQNNMECIAEYTVNRHDLESWCYSKLRSMENSSDVCPDCHGIIFGRGDKEKCRICREKHHRSWEYKVFKNIQKKCPSDKPLIGFDCYSCDTKWGVNAENCEVCPNRIIDKNGWCVLN